MDPSQQVRIQEKTQLEAVNENIEKMKNGRERKGEADRFPISTLHLHLHTPLEPR
jgi:hypothetical protein